MQCQLQYILASVLCKHCPSGMDMHMRVYSRIVVCKRCGYTYIHKHRIELCKRGGEGRGRSDGWVGKGWVGKGWSEEWVGEGWSERWAKLVL